MFPQESGQNLYSLSGPLLRPVVLTFIWGRQTTLLFGDRASFNSPASTGRFETCGACPKWYTYCREISGCIKLPGLNMLFLQLVESFAILAGETHVVIHTLYLYSYEYEYEYNTHMNVHMNVDINVDTNTTVYASVYIHWTYRFKHQRCFFWPTHFLWLVPTPTNVFIDHPQPEVWTKTPSGVASWKGLEGISFDHGWHQSRRGPWSNLFPFFLLFFQFLEHYGGIGGVIFGENW